MRGVRMEERGMRRQEDEGCGGSTPSWRTHSAHVNFDEHMISTSCSTGAIMVFIIILISIIFTIMNIVIIIAITNIIMSTIYSSSP